MKRPLPEIEPFTLEEAETMLLKIENDAWYASSKAEALDFILGNLVLRLDEAGLIDGQRFVDDLQPLLPGMSKPLELGAQPILDGLRVALLQWRGGERKGYVLH